MTPDDMRPRLLRELADVVTKPLSIILKNHGSQAKSGKTGKRETSFPFLKRVEEDSHF